MLPVLKHRRKSTTNVACIDLLRIKCMRCCGSLTICIEPIIVCVPEPLLNKLVGTNTSTCDILINKITVHKIEFVLFCQKIVNPSKRH